MGFPLREETITPEELLGSSEVFLTGTSASIMPVESIDDQEVGQSCPGPITNKLRDRLSRIECGKDPEFEHWLTNVEEISV